MTRDACIEKCRQAWTSGADAERATVVRFLRILTEDGRMSASDAGLARALIELIEAGEHWNVREVQR
jgi:hypothetical protein